MKRFHVHLHVTDLVKNVDFYSKMFGTAPARLEHDYAKWMLDEPAVNFAISTQGQGTTGIDHFGIQVDNEADLLAMKSQAQAADLLLVDEGATSCCYAKSDKHWIVDPQGLPWEQFRNLGDIPLFREGDDAHQPAAMGSACCAPKVTGKPDGIPVKSSCC